MNADISNEPPDRNQFGLTPVTDTDCRGASGITSKTLGFHKGPQGYVVITPFAGWETAVANQADAGCAYPSSAFRAWD